MKIFLLFPTQFNPAAGITPSHQDFKGGPKLKDKIHVACLVINATKISSVSSGIQEKLRSLVGMLRQRGTSYQIKMNVSHAMSATHAYKHTTNEDILIF
jgi:hypothetical protein